MPTRLTENLLGIGTVLALPPSPHPLLFPGSCKPVRYGQRRVQQAGTVELVVIRTKVDHSLT